MKSPTPRGPLSDALASLVDRPRNAAAAPTSRTADLARLAGRAVADGDVVHDDDAQLALFVLYELAYRGIEGVDDDWEWDVGLLAVRAVLEEALERELRTTVRPPAGVPATRSAVSDALFAMTAPTPGPSLSRFVAKQADERQVEELLVHRSIYQLKEADPHTWAIPRLEGPPKAALVEIQADEYGGGSFGRMHSELFARTMRGVGLDDTYGRYVDDVPAVTLASVNTMSLFGLHRRLRGAIVGHLAAFEMTSSLPNKRYGDGFRRLGHDADTTWYFDEHVEADAVHEQIAGRDLAGGLAEREPGLVGDILFGAAACLHLDELVGQHLLDAWQQGRSSLRAA